MQEIFTDVNWVAIIVGAVVAFILGWVWYSPIMFSETWKQGIGTPVVPNRPMVPLLIVQFVGSLLFAWALVVALQSSLELAILVAVATAALIKANGLFAGKSMAAIAIESSYVLAQAVIMILVAQLFN